MTVLIKEDDLNQTIRRNNRAVCGGQFFGGIQTERNILDFAVAAYAVCFVHFKALDYVDFHTLTLIVKLRACFCHFNFLPCIHKLHGMGFIIQHHAIRGGHFPYLILSEIKLLRFRCSVLASGKRVHNLAFLGSYRAVCRDDVLGCGNLINCSL